MANEFKVRKGLIVQGSGSNIFDVQGSQGQLFSITDSLSGSLFSVNDISGIPIMEVFSDNTIKMGTFNQEAIIVSGSRTGMGIATPQAELHISGANNDSLFRIQSPASASIMFVSGSGLVGIGTLTPTQKISVDNGNVGFTSGFGISWDSDTEWIRRATGSDQLQLATQNTIRLNIGSTQGQLVTIGLGATTGTAQFQVRGGGATAATTAMRIEDSGGNARLTILDDGTSAFNTNHLYVSSSGRVGIGTGTPTNTLQVVGGITATSLTASIISASSGITASQYSGIPTFTYNDNNFQSVNIINTSNTSNALNGLTIYSASNAAVGQFLYLNPIYANSALRDTVLFNTVGDRKLGFVANSNTAAGANSDIYFQAGSTTAGRMIYISGQAGAMGIGMGASTPTSTNRLQVRGQGATSSTTALRVENSSAAARLTILDDGTSAFNTNHLYVSSSGLVGIGTTLPSAELHISGASADNLLRVGSPIDSSILFVTGNGRVGIGTAFPSSSLTVSGTIESLPVSTDEGGQLTLRAATGRSFKWNVDNYQDNFRIFRENDPDSSGGVVRILISGSSGNVGIHTTAPTEWIYLSTTPSSGKYLNIDAAQNSNPPNEYIPGGGNMVGRVWGNIVDDYVLGTPDYWMEIKLGGVIVLVPCYIPA